jgi:hypothetical protein
MNKDEVVDIAELEVRRYFDHFLEKTLPCILARHTDACPHGKRVSKWKWMVAGVLSVLTCTGSVYGFVRILQLL